MKYEEFFTNDNILKCLGYPSSFHNHERHVVHSTKDDIEYITKAIEDLKIRAREYEERNNSWIKKNV